MAQTVPGARASATPPVRGEDRGRTTRRAATPVTDVTGDTCRHASPDRASARLAAGPRDRTGRGWRFALPPGRDADADDPRAPGVGPGGGRQPPDRADRPAHLVRADRHGGAAVRGGPGVQLLRLLVPEQHLRA